MDKNKFLAASISVSVLAFLLVFWASANVVASYLFAALLLGNTVSFISSQIHRLPRNFNTKDIKPFDWKYFYKFSLMAYIAFTIVIILPVLFG